MQKRTVTHALDAIQRSLFRDGDRFSLIAHGAMCDRDCCSSRPYCRSNHVDKEPIKSKLPEERYSSLSKLRPYGDAHRSLGRAYTSAIKLCGNTRYMINVEPDCAPVGQLLASVFPRTSASEYTAHVLPVNTVSAKLQNYLRNVSGVVPEHYSFTCGAIFTKATADCAFSQKTINAVLDTAPPVYPQDLFVSVLFAYCGVTLRRSPHVTEVYASDNVPYGVAFVHGDKSHYEK